MELLSTYTRYITSLPLPHVKAPLAKDILVVVWLSSPELSQNEGRKDHQQAISTHDLILLWSALAASSGKESRWIMYGTDLASSQFMIDFGLVIAVSPDLS